MRYAYIKSGDVLAEYGKIRASAQAPDGGPLVYLTQFLEVTEGHTRLVLGTGSDHSRPALADGNTRLEGMGGGGAARRAWRILRALLRHRPGVIICGERNLSLAATALAARLTGARTVFSVHSTLDPSSTRPHHRLLSRLNALCMRRMDACLCHGPFLTRHITQIRGNGTNVLTFDRGMDGLPEPTFPPLPETPRIVLFMGRLERAKGIFDLLAAMRGPLERNPDLRLDYVGDGPDKEELRAEIRTLGLEGRVELAGRVPHADIAARLETAWVTVTPTHSSCPEGRCMTAMESLHFGTPLIAPGHEPFLFLVQDGVNGLLYASDSVPALRRQLERVLGDPDLRAALSEGARRTPSRLRGHDDFGTALAKALRLVEAPERSA
ncbi:MAG: glycosyltransferase [Desulfovibrio sp.]